MLITRSKLRALIREEILVKESKYSGMSLQNVLGFFDKYSNNTWIFFDQVDWIIGSLIFVSFYINISLKQVIISVILFGIIHPIINILGYFLKIKKNKF